jgi:hypothetical protein
MGPSKIPGVFASLKKSCSAMAVVCAAQMHSHRQDIHIKSSSFLATLLSGLRHAAGDGPYHLFKALVIGLQICFTAAIPDVFPSINQTRMDLSIVK